MPEKNIGSSARAKWRICVRIVIGAIMLALLTSAAYAQKKDPGPLPERPSQKVDERTYRDTINRIPDQTPSSDPWSRVRDTGAADNKNKKPSDSK